MVNKRGLIKLVEATLGILLIFSFLLFFSLSKTQSTTLDPTSLLNPVLEEIASDKNLRAEILAEDSSGSQILAAEKLKNYNFEISICDPLKLCAQTQFPDEVYTAEKIISSTLNEYKPKKLKIYLWQK